MFVKGKCQCGCGEDTTPARCTDPKRGWVKGEPKAYVHGHNRRKSGVAYAVEDRGFVTPCWIWKRTTNAAGYGYAADETGKVRRAHRLYWEREHGPIPPSLTLDHLCNNRACVNPAHLEPKSHAANCRRSSSTLLSFDQVDAIRERVAAGERQRKLAVEYGVHFSTISKIVKGKNWSKSV